MNDELITVNKAHLISLVKRAYEEGRQDNETTNTTGIEWLYQDSVTKEQLNKLLKGE